MTVLFAQQNGNWNTNNIWNTQPNGSGNYIIPEEYDICVSNGYDIIVNQDIKVLQLRSDAYLGSASGGDFTFASGIVVNVDTQSLVNSKLLINMKGPRGSSGLSAYQLATQNGFNGTEQEWLESLKGNDPVLTWSGDQLEINGVVSGPHLTGPAGSGTGGSSNFKGIWNNTTEYTINDIVVYSNQLFIATNDNTNSPPLTITPGSAFSSESNTPTINYDGTPKEVGLNFIANYDIVLTGVKFYKPTNNSFTTIIIKLWTDKIPIECRSKYITETGWVSVYFDRVTNLYQNNEYQVSISLDHIVTNPDEFVGDGNRGLITTIYNSGRVTGDWVINAYPYNGSTTGYYIYPIVEQREPNSNWTNLNIK
jgi:hypothetical protein